MTYRVRNLGIAAMLAALAAVLVTLYVTNYRQHVRDDESGVAVLVAARDIPIGTPGSRLVSGHLLTTVLVPRRTVVPGAISSPEQIRQFVVTQPLFAGDQVTSRRFGSVLAQGVQGQLKGTMRAFQVPGDGNQLLAGTLESGDRVDVVAAIKFTDTGTSTDTERVASRIVLRNIQVIQAPDAVGATVRSGPARGDLSVILSVTDSQAQKLFFVMRVGEWSLALRPSADAADSPDSVETAQSVLADGLVSAERLRLAPAGGGR